MVKKWRGGFPSSLLSNWRRSESTASQIENLSADVGVSGESRGHDLNPDETSAIIRLLSTAKTTPISKDSRYKQRAEKITRNEAFDVIEVAKEVSEFIRANPRWEEKLLENFPTVDFVRPCMYKGVLRSESDPSLYLRFYYWLKSLNGFVFDPVTYNVLFSRLVKANLANDAKKLLDDTGIEPDPKNLELYIGCLCKAGLFQDVLHVFERLREIGHSVSRWMWNTALSSSVAAGRDDVLSRIQEEMVEAGVKKDMGYSIRNEKITGNEGFDVIEVAKEVSKFIRANPKWEEKLLENFPEVDFVKPEMYKGVLRSESDPSLSLRFYYCLRSLNGFVFDPVLYNMIFSRLVKANLANDAKKLLDDTEIEPNPKDLELYIGSLSKAGLFEDVLHVFKRLREMGHSVSRRTWNTALSFSVAAKRGDVLGGIQEEMVEAGVEKDLSTLCCSMQALCLDSDSDKAYELLRQVMDAGHFPDDIFLNKLVSALCKSGDFGKATAVLHHTIAKGRKPSFFSYQVFIHELCKQGRISEAVLLFNELKRRGYFPYTVMYTTLIHALCREEKVEDAKELWSEMIKTGIPPNEHTYNALLDGLWKNNCIPEAESLHKEMVERGYGDTTATFNTMISGLCFNGKVEEAHLLFGEMAEKGIARDRITYSVVINCFILHGKTMEAVSVLYKSLTEGIKPSTSSFSHLIRRLCDDGSVKEANTLWEDMHNMGFEPPYLCLEPIVAELSKQENFAGVAQCLCHMINNGYMPKKSLSNLVQSLSLTSRFDSVLSIHSYLLKRGILLDVENQDNKQQLLSSYFF